MVETKQYNPPLFVSVDEVFCYQGFPRRVGVGGVALEVSGRGAVEEQPIFWRRV